MSDDFENEQDSDVTTEDAETQENIEEKEAAEKKSGKKFEWYIAKTLTGQENKVSRAIKERVVDLKMGEFFDEILVPEETVTSNANGKKRTYKKKFFPGYVLIRMVMTPNSWHLVKDTDKITGFLGGTSERPQPISDDEAAYMTNRSAEGVKKVKTTVNFQEGDSVKVTEGPFASFVGTIESVKDTGKIKVNVSIFGRPTPVELDFSQVEKV